MVQQPTLAMLWVAYQRAKQRRHLTERRLLGEAAEQYVIDNCRRFESYQVPAPIAEMIVADKATRSPEMAAALDAEMVCLLAYEEAKRTQDEQLMQQAVVSAINDRFSEMSIRVGR